MANMDGGRGRAAAVWLLVGLFGLLVTDAAVAAKRPVVRPTKITGADFNAAGNDVAVESLEITHDALTVSNN